MFFDVLCTLMKRVGYLLQNVNLFDNFCDYGALLFCLCCYNGHRSQLRKKGKQSGVAFQFYYLITLLILPFCFCSIQFISLMYRWQMFHSCCSCSFQKSLVLLFYVRETFLIHVICAFHIWTLTARCAKMTAWRPKQKRTENW